MEWTREQIRAYKIVRYRCAVLKYAIDGMVERGGEGENECKSDVETTRIGIKWRRLDLL